MSNTSNEEVQYQSSTSPTTFQVIERVIQNQHAFQLYIMYGTQPGPWLMVGFNDREYAIGFLPEPAVPIQLRPVTA